MEQRKIVKAHSQIKHMIEVSHYEDHLQREESEEFRHIKETLHKSHARCYIDNGFCEGNLEIHHNYVEYAAETEVDWAKVQEDVALTGIDQMPNMLPLCRKHHRDPGFGIHEIEYPVWRLQKYMTKEALEKFESDVKKALREDEDHE